MQVRRLAVLVGLPVIVAGGLVACSGKSGNGAGGGTSAVVSVGIAEPQNIFPSNAGETAGAQVIYAMFAGLYDYDKTGRAFNVIADSVTTTDSKVWTVKLKDGFTFHNGEKVDSDSFINAWNWGAYGPNGSNVNSYYSQIDGYAELNPDDPKAKPTGRTLRGLAKVDALTFTITLAAPFA